MSKSTATTPTAVSPKSAPTAPVAPGLERIARLAGRGIAELRQFGTRDRLSPEQARFVGEYDKASWEASITLTNGLSAIGRVLAAIADRSADDGDGSISSDLLDPETLRSVGWLVEGLSTMAGELRETSIMADEVAAQQASFGNYTVEAGFTTPPPHGAKATA